MIPVKIKYCLKSILLILTPVLFLSFDTADSETAEGEVDFTVKTITYNGDRSPKNIVAISVYPTVSRDYFTIRTTTGQSTISVYDLTGSLVLKVVTHETETLVSAPGPGMYFLRVENNGTVETFRIIQAK